MKVHKLENKDKIFPRINYLSTGLTFPQNWATFFLHKALYRQFEYFIVRDNTDNIYIKEVNEERQNPI